MTVSMELVHICPGQLWRALHRDSALKRRTGTDSVAVRSAAGLGVNRA